MKDILRFRKKNTGLCIAVDVIRYNSDDPDNDRIYLLLSMLCELRKRGIDIILLITENNRSIFSGLEEDGFHMYYVPQGIKEKTDQAREDSDGEIITGMSKRHISVRMIGYTALSLIKKTIMMILPYFIVTSLMKSKRWILKSRECLRSLIEYSKNHIRPKPFSELTKFLNKTCDVLYCPLSSIYNNESKVRTVFALEDVHHIYKSDCFSTEDIKDRGCICENLVKQRPYIITYSEFARKAFIETYNYPKDRIETLYPAYHKRFENYSDVEFISSIKALNLEPRKFIYYPANLMPNRNHKALFLAYRMFMGRNRDAGYWLIITDTSKGDIQLLMYDEMIESMGLKDNVKLLETVSEKEYGALLKYCRFLLYPSFYGGMGMVIAEAMAMGTTILCSNTASLPEFGGKGVFYFDPHNPKSMCEKMEYVLMHPEEEEKRKRSYYPELLDRYSIDSYSDKMLDIFKKCRMGYSA